MLSENAPANPTRVRGWILDIYPSALGEIAVWIIGENGERIRLTDKFEPKIYVSGKEEDIERLASRFFAYKAIASWNFTYKSARAQDTEKSKVLEITLEDCRKTTSFVRSVLELGRYLRYQVHNCDLRGDQAYLYERGIFPLALVNIETEKSGLKYSLQDSTESTDYRIPPLRMMRISVEICKKGKLANLKDPIDKITVTQADNQTTIDTGDEGEKLLKLTETVKELDPDIIITNGGDSHLFPYLAQRAAVNNVLDELVLSRDDVPLIARQTRGRSFFSYGRTYYRAPLRRLYGRVHVDEANTFILSECGLDGLIEIARTCMVPLHTASRSSIGSAMSSLQFCQALKDDVLIPRNKGIPEAFKSAYELLVGDRGGFVYEPEVGIHDDVGEVDFASMYPSLMVNNNISAETVLCKCCPNSKLRIPELGYNICEKRTGIVPKALKPVILKRLLYKKLKAETQNPQLKEAYDNRQTALKWILVTCFGYLGYRNARFGTVDGHIGVCALGREAFLKASHGAEKRGFRVIHGIVDSLWLKKAGATIEEYLDLCKNVSEEIKVPLNFEGCYKWIVFLPSKMHPAIGVLNRYYGVKEDGTIKVRGIDARRRDTPKFVCDAQMEMIKVLASANNSREFLGKVPEALEVVKEYRRKLLEGEVSTWDLIITKHLSKPLERYKQKVSQVIAAGQLVKEGAEIHAGNNIRFLLTSTGNKHYERRVRAEELIEKDTNPDIKKYLLLLYAAAANLLSPLKFTEREVYYMSRGQRITTLTRFQEKTTTTNTAHCHTCQPVAQQQQKDEAQC
jgi:DNA polymerase elongation subunit (family B)